LAFVPPTYLYNDNPASAAAALATARETPKIAFAPNFPLLSVPSKPIRVESILFCSNIVECINASLIIVFILETA
jgi:hypothetical protein